CKGIIKLYPLDKSAKNLHIHVAMRIFNVDRTHPTLFHHSILAVNRNTQTDWCQMNQKVQTNATMQHAAIQVNERTKHVITKDAAVQLSAKISQQQLTKVIAEIISQLLSANEKKQQLQKNSGNKLSIIGENLCQIKFGNLTGRKINLPKKPIRRNVEYFNAAQKKTTCQRSRILKLANLSNYPKRNVERLCNKPAIGLNEFRDQRYSNIIGNPSNSYNAICRRQLLYKLDQLIAQKMITLRKIHMLKSVNQKDALKNSKRKIERFCQMSANRLHRLNKQPVDIKLPSATQKSNNTDRNSSYTNSSKLASPTATKSECISSSTVRNSIEKLKNVAERCKNSSHIISESDEERSPDSDSDNGDNGNNDVDNGNSVHSTARTVSTIEFSSEASTITELQSIK
ncbi:unnamed protein product, partial [Acanthocheilonema viteae]